MGPKWSVVQLVDDLGIGPLPAPLDRFRRRGVIPGGLNVGFPADITLNEKRFLFLRQLKGADIGDGPLGCHGLEQRTDRSVSAVQVPSPLFFFGRLVGRLGGLGRAGFFGCLAPVLILWLCFAIVIHRW